MRGGWNFFFKINKRQGDSMFIREMRVSVLEKYTHKEIQEFFLLQVYSCIECSGMSENGS